MFYLQIQNEQIIFTAVCLPMTPHLMKGRTSFFLLLQEPQGEVLIIKPVSSFSVFIQKPDHTPQRQTEEDAHTAVLKSTLVHSLLSDRPIICLCAWLRVFRAGVLHFLTVIILTSLFQQVEWLVMKQSSSGRCKGVSFHHTVV